MALELAPTTDPFVGRAHELDLFEAMCASATHGRGSMAVVSGAAGIGKTRFCDEAAGRARRNGLTVISARCWVDGGAPPLWPWQPILAELCGEDAAALLTSDTGLETVDADRFARFAAATERLAAATAVAPVCLTVDDVHAADAGTLLLIRFVARALGRLRLVLLLTRRHGEPAGDRTEARLLDDIEREATPIALPRFDTGEAAALLAGHGMGLVDADVLAAVVRVTDGNPLFLRRVAALGTPGRGQTLPSGVRIAIDQATDRLDREAVGVLRAGAVLGPGPSIVETATVAGCAPAVVLDAVAEGAAAGLVTTQGTDGFSFTHELVRAALEDGLDAADRLDAHARAASIVAGDSPAAPADRLARRAHHALAAAPRSADDACLAVSACRRAARSMVARFAYEQADALLSAAVALHEPAHLGPPPGQLLTEWAQAALRCGNMTDARGRFDRAVAAADQEDDPVLFAEAALGLGGHWVNEHRSPVERARVLGLQRSARTGLPASADALRCRLDARLAAEAVFDGGPIGPVLDAVGAARRNGDRLALAEALSVTHHALFTPEHTHARLPLADELVQVASEAGHGVLGLMGLCWRAVDLIHLGDPHAGRALEDLRERATDLTCQSILYIVGVVDAMLLFRAGRLDDAEAAAQASYQAGAAVGEVDSLGYLSSQMLGIRWAQARDDELLDAAEEVAASPTLIRAEFALRASAAAIAARAGHTALARAALDRLTADGLAALPSSSTWAPGMVAIVEVAAELGDELIARQAYDLLAPYADLPVIASVGVMCLGSTHRSLGIAARTFGDGDLAVLHLERAVTANAQLGNRPLTAIARADLADALVHRDGADDRPRAADQLDRAVADAIGMGMTVRAAAWRRRLADVRTTGRRGDLRRDGPRWVVTLDGRQARVGDLVGMAYLADLLTHPDRSVAAIDIARGGAAPPSPSRHEVLDDRARAEYRARARRLGDDIAAAEARDDRARAEQLRAELDALVDELEAATGLGGRARVFADEAERARTAVRKAIKRAIDAIDDADPTIADALRATVTTGATCVYTPDRHAPVTWTAR